MGTRRPRPVVFDAGAFIAFERNDRRVRTLVELAVSSQTRIHTAAGVIAQVWRDGARQVRLSRLMASGVVEVRPLDLEEAQAAGTLCGQRQSRDVVDASLALLARRLSAVVVTSDPNDLKHLDSKIDVLVC